jgi:hypothetical protein
MKDDLEGECEFVVALNVKTVVFWDLTTWDLAKIEARRSSKHREDLIYLKEPHHEDNIIHYNIIHYNIIHYNIIHYTEDWSRLLHRLTAGNT